MREGELDFLQGRILCVHVSDMRLTFLLSLQQARLVTARREQAPDLSITGSLHAFLSLAARREDSDTLFFQRRLHMGGDTELGLEVKNFLDGLDLESLWLHRQVGSALRRALPVYERLFSWSVEPDHCISVGWASLRSAPTYGQARNLTRCEARHQ